MRQWLTFTRGLKNNLMSVLFPPTQNAPGNGGVKRESVSFDGHRIRDRRIIPPLYRPVNSNRPVVAVGRIPLSRYWLLELFVGRITIRTQLRSNWLGASGIVILLSLGLACEARGRRKQTGALPQAFRRASYALDLNERLSKNKPLLLLRSTGAPRNSVGTNITNYHRRSRS